jgi:asparaginyl-tRNA synthetase
MLKVRVKCCYALPFDGTPRTEDGKVNYKEDFFGKETNLTVSY